MKRSCEKSATSWQKIEILGTHYENLPNSCMYGKQTLRRTSCYNGKMSILKF